MSRDKEYEAGLAATGWRGFLTAPTTGRRYAATAMFVLLAVGVGCGIAPLLGGGAAFILFVAAALIAGWYGGIGPGLATFLAGLLLGNFFFLSPLYQFGPYVPANQVLMLVYAVVGTIGLAIVKNLHGVKYREQRTRTAAGKLARNLAEQERREEALRLAKERLDVALEAARLCTWDFNLQTLEIEWYCEHDKLLGPGVVGFHGSVKDFLAHVHPEDRTLKEQMLTACARERTPCHLEFRVIWADGTVHWIYCQGKLVPNHGKPLERISGILMEITERKLQEEALRHSENRYRAQIGELEVLYKAAPWGLALVDRNLRYLRINDVLAEGNSLSPSQIIGRTVREVIPMLADKVEPLYQQVLNTGESLVGLEIHGWTAKQPRSERDWLASYYPLKDVNGAVTGVNAIVVDITERKQVEETVRQSEARLHELADLMPQIVWAARPDGTIEYVNKKWFEYSGLTAEQAYTYESWKMVIHPQDEPRATNAIHHALQTGEPLQMETRIKQKEDCYRWHLSRALPVRDESGRIVRWYATSTDIEDQKRAEQELNQARNQLARHAQELEQRVARRTAKLEQTVRSLEGVLYHVAHDLRAPLRTMASFTQLLLEAVEPQLDEAARDSAERIVAAAQRMDQLILDLLAYGRLGHLNLSFRPVDLKNLLDIVLLGLALEIKAGNAEVQVIGSFPTVRADPDVLHQALIEIIKNALTFVKRDVTPQVRLWAEMRGASARLWIEDNGIGIKPGYCERIFRVFERLHPAGEYPGTGIGLAIVWKAMERMKGAVGVESEPGKGSRFWVELPVDAKEKESVKPGLSDGIKNG